MAANTRVLGACLLTALIGVVIAAADADAATETLQVSFNTSDNSAANEGFWANIPPNPPTYEHVVAVWLEDAGGNYVKTLVRWGNIYPHDLRAWPRASDLDVDAVTGATRSNAGPHATGLIDITMIPDQIYEIELESSDLNNPGPGRTNRATYTFDKTGTGATLTPADQGGFTGVTISYSGRSGGGYVPGVYAGPERWITLPSTLSLAGLASSDVGISSVIWDTVGGPASVTFTPSDALSTTASFPREGVYVLSLAVTDGAALQSIDEVTVLVNAMDLVPVADSEVSSASPGTPWPNNDFRIRIWKQTDAEKEREGFVKFDLSGVPGEPTGATLRLSMNDWWPLTGGDLTCDVQGVGDGWTESGITWNNSRFLTGATLASFWADSPLWTEMDVGAFVAGEHASDQVASFHILHRNIHNTSGSRFNSREKNVKPTLRVTYNCLPTVSIGSPTAGSSFDEGTSISFSCTASDPEGTPLGYSWDSDLDGQIGTTASFSTTSLSAGSHTITVTVTDARGGQTSDSVSITVLSISGNRPPAVNLTGSPTSGYPPLAVNFDANSSDLDGDPLVHEWDWDYDGMTFSASANTGAVATASHTYATVGSHTAAVRVSDGQNPPVIDTLTINITVPDPTVITFPADGQGLVENQTYQLTGTGSGTLSWSYDANSDGLGKTGIGAGSPRSFTVPTGVTSPREITIYLDADAGEVSILCSIVAAGTNAPPTVNLTATPTSGDSPLAVGFDANSDDADGDALVHEWDWDYDGTTFAASADTGAASTTSHTYDVGGTYVAAVRVSDGRNPRVIDSIAITVSEKEGADSMIFGCLPGVQSRTGGAGCRLPGGPVGGGLLLGYLALGGAMLMLFCRRPSTCSGRVDPSGPFAR